MADFGGLLPAGWAVTLGILALILHRVWRWSGTALPPAAVVDKKYIGESIPESTPPESKLDGAEYAGRVRIASDVMYQRAPYIETVRVRAFAIESLVVIICGLVFIDPSTTILHWSNEQIVAFPILSGGIAVLCFVSALFVGAFRQLFGSLLSHAGALPVVDDRGRPKFTYIGDVPPSIWQYSPWFRAVTWVLVAAPSLVSALIGSRAADQLLEGAFTPTLIAILVLRWLISAIPNRIAQRQNARIEAELEKSEDAGVVELTMGGYSDDALWEKHMAAGSAAYECGNLAEAARNLELARNEAEEFGDQDSRLGVTLNNLGGLHKVQGRYGEAEPLYKQSLEIFEKALGPDHPDVAESLDGLATIYEARGKYAEAEPLFKRALAIQEKELGPDDERTGSALNNLAHLYRTLGRYPEAEPLFKRALAVTEKALGSEHPEVARTLNNLAELYRLKGEYTNAESYIRRSLEISETVLGQDHQDVALGLNALGLIYSDKGEYAEAESALKRSVEIKGKGLGPDHPELAVSLQNLATVYDVMSKHAEAEPLYHRSLAIFEKVVGPESPEVALSLSNLAEFYRVQGRYEEAEPLYERALIIQEKVLGLEHPDLVSLVETYAALLRNLGRTAKAAKLEAQAKVIRAKQE